MRWISYSMWFHSFPLITLYEQDGEISPHLLELSFSLCTIKKRIRKKKEKLIKASITNLHFIKCQYRILILRNHYMLAKEILLLGKEILLHFFIARSPLWILFILHGLYFVHLQYVVFSFPCMIYSLMLNLSKIIFFTFL